MSVAADPSTALTPQQHQAIVLLAEGQSATAVARACGLHRTTIHHWRRTNTDFALALHDAQTDLADFWRTETQARAATALKALDDLLADPKTPAGVRLKAVLYILNTATAIPDNAPLLAPQPKAISRPEPAVVVAKTETESEANQRLTLAAIRTLDVPDAAEAAADAAFDAEWDELIRRDPTLASRRNRPPLPPIHHNSSLSTNTPGRNAKCPCQSGRKYKQCCLNQPASRKSAA